MMAFRLATRVFSCAFRSRVLCPCLPCLEFCSLGPWLRLARDVGLCCGRIGVGSSFPAVHGGVVREFGELVTNAFDRHLVEYA